MSEKTKLYLLGNCLRGFFEGKFHSARDAAIVLSCRFDQSFPSDGGRRVLMYCYETNPYGHEQFLIVNSSIETRGDIDKYDIIVPLLAKETKKANWFRG